MGYGSYSYSDRSTRVAETYSVASRPHQVFKSKTINNKMDPYKLTKRESRDSVDHPNSFPIIIALDVTGSMGSIPLYFIKEGLPNIMKKLMDSGIPDPQILFLGIGDHECDTQPLQVGQFESSDELLDYWLENVFLEGGGGGNEGESYLMAWKIGALHTVTDSFEKRNKKGVLITIGDEPTLKKFPKSADIKILGSEESSDWTSDQLLEKASVSWECFHLHICETRAGGDPQTKVDWKQLMGSNLKLVSDKTKLDEIISELITKQYTSGAQAFEAEIAIAPKDSSSLKITL